MKIDNIVPQGLNKLTLNDLGIKPNNMEQNMLDGILFNARGQDIGGIGMRKDSYQHIVRG